MKALEPDMIFPGEEIVHVTGYHWIYVLKSFLPLVLILIVGTFTWSLMPSRLTSTLIMLALIVSMVWIVVKVLDTVVKRCYVTNRRLINRSGWTKRDTQDVTLDRIGGIFLDQTPIERFFGYGRVRLIVPIIQIPLPEYLRNPLAFRKALYIKPVAKAPEKPDDDETLAEEHDRMAKDEDDRFGADTVSLKELQEAANDLEGESLGADLGADLGSETSDDIDSALAEADTDTDSDALADASDGADGSEDT